jgi:hypothetical protein
MSGVSHINTDLMFRREFYSRRHILGSVCLDNVFRAKARGTACFIGRTRALDQSVSYLRTQFAPFCNVGVFGRARILLPVSKIQVEF